MQFRDHGALLDMDSSLVLVVDMQEAFRSGVRGFSSILPSAVKIVSAARVLGIPVVGTEQSPHLMGATVQEITQIIDERSFHPKESFSAVRVLEVADTIEKAQPQSIVLLGCETHVAVLQTALQLLSSYDGHVHLVVDATASRRDRDRDLALGRLQRTGVHLTSSEMVLFEWLRDTRHPKFQLIGGATPTSSLSDPSVS